MFRVYLKKELLGLLCSSTFAYKKKWGYPFLAKVHILLIKAELERLHNMRSPHRIWLPGNKKEMCWKARQALDKGKPLYVGRAEFP